MTAMAIENGVATVSTTYDEARLESYFGSPVHPQTGQIDWDILNKYAKLVYFYWGDIHMELLRPYLPDVAEASAREGIIQNRMTTFKNDLQRRVWGSSAFIRFVKEKSAHYNDNAPANAYLLHELPGDGEYDFWSYHIIQNNAEIMRNTLAVFGDVIDIWTLLSDLLWSHHLRKIFIKACFFIYHVDLVPQIVAGTTPPILANNVLIHPQQVYQYIREFIIRILYQAWPVHRIPLVPPAGPAQAQIQPQS